jgi:hypothetical protein
MSQEAQSQEVRSNKAPQVLLLQLKHIQQQEIIMMSMSRIAEK